MNGLRYIRTRCNLSLNELFNVWKAMLLAYGLLDKSQIQYLDKSEYHCGEDGEWILHLAEQIEEHWREEQAFHEKQHNLAVP